MWNSTKEFQADLFASYRASKLQRGKKLLPMGRHVFLLGSKQKKARPPKKVASALRVLDDLILDALLWHQSFILMVAQENSALDEALRTSLAALLMRITQDAMVIRLLIHGGYDVQARNLLRSVDEHIDAVYYLCLKPDLCAEFLKTEDNDLANKFWWAHFKKARKVIDAALSAMAGIDATISEFSAFKAQERENFSMAHHPTRAASTVPFWVPYKGANMSLYIFGAQSEYSYRTGKYLFYLLAEAVIFMSLFNKDIGAAISRKGRGTLRKLVRGGGQHMITMLLHLIQNWESPLFSSSKEMETMWNQAGNRSKETSL